MATISIDDYVCNLIAGKKIIGQIYGAVSRAREINGRGGNYVTTIRIPGLGCKTYGGLALLQIANRALSCSFQGLIDKYAPNGVLTIDFMVAILLKGQPQISMIFWNNTTAQYMRSAAKSFMAYFSNPFGKYAHVSCQKFAMGGYSYLKFYCRCSNNVFDPTLVFDLAA